MVPTSVASIIILTSGTGYSTSPITVLTPIGAGSGAAATPTISNGAIIGLTFGNIDAYTLKAPTISTTAAGTTQGTGSGASIILNLLNLTTY